MTEQELIEIAKREWYKLDEVEDKSLITKNVIDNLLISNRDWYHKVLKGVAPECFSKEKALQLLKFDKEIYGLLTKELQEDPDILELTTCNIDKLPQALFDSKVGVNFVLDKYNVEGKSWAVYDINKKGLAIKRDINVRKYIVYCYGLLQIEENEVFENDFLQQKFISISDEVFFLTFNRRRHDISLLTDVKHLN